jgi:hypothetical protein
VIIAATVRFSLMPKNATTITSMRIVVGSTVPAAATIAPGVPARR